MEVALIDTGIRQDLLKRSVVKADMIVEASGEIHLRQPENRIITAHGTVCAQIIENYAEKVEFYSLQIFSDKEERATCDQFLSALRWCCEKKIPVVHMSIGTTYLPDAIRIYPVVKKMLKQGQLLVAAYSNSAKISYPAAFRGVLGVTADPKMKEDEFEYKGWKRNTNFSASSFHKIEIAKDVIVQTPLSNSYAAPVITAAVCSR